jgi:hypothetical protein
MEVNDGTKVALEFTYRASGTARECRQDSCTPGYEERMATAQLWNSFSQNPSKLIYFGNKTIILFSLTLLLVCQSDFLVQRLKISESKDDDYNNTNSVKLFIIFVPIQ